MSPDQNASGREELYVRLRDFYGEVSFWEALPYGLQHVLTMFVANLAPMLLICAAADFDADTRTMIIQNAMMVAGLGTFVQLYSPLKVGAKMPIVMGVSISFAALLSSIASTKGYEYVVGAVVIGGLIETALGLCARYWKKYVNGIVAGTVVTAIGFSLLSVGANSFGGGSGAPDFGSPANLLIGSVSLVMCLLVQVLASDKYKPLSVLVGMASGYLVAIFAGKVDFSGFQGINLVTVPRVMPFGMKFDLSSIIAVSLLYVVSITDTIGDTEAVAKIAFGREADEEEMRGSITADGLTSSLSGLFGCLPLDSFGQNVGLIGLTHIINRKAIASGAVILVAAGFLPVIGTLFSTVPNSVLGGCTIMMFGSIMTSGIQMISQEGFTQRNITIVSVSLAVGIGFSQAKDILSHTPAMIQTLFGGNSVALCFICAFLLNILIPDARREQGD